MLRYCTACGKIFGCVKKEKYKKECISCNEEKDCKLDIMYPRQKVEVDICYQHKVEAIQKAQKERQSNRNG